ncbi:MAG: TolC family protein [Bacteroidales bacterium]|nr:TolC family protein [Bacteroidales bacterium]MBQ6081654.1 TolC family protein [Bacteroidales bacterium]MBQ7458166.1 TolC family protein [Bacteroidales bacterium]MBQ9529408.1 TolC family protein [Bacteroidales bacterium]
MKINIKRVGIAVQLIVALAVSTFSVSAADKLSLSLQQAMDLAVERNNTLANAALDVKIAKANKWAAIAQMLPQVSASGDYSNFMGYEMDLRGMTIAMPPYVTLGLRSSLTFTPALLVNTQISEISHKMSDISLQQSEQDITNQVKTLYLSALVSEEVLNLLGRNLECLERLHDMTMTSVRVGASEQTAADQIEVQVAQLKNSIASSKRAIEMTYNSMRLLLDVDVDTELELTDTLDRLMETDDYLELVSEDFDLERNYAWQLANKSTELAKKQLDATIMAGLPSLTAYHQYSYKEYLSKDANVMNMTPPNMVGATLSVPLFTSLQQTKKVQAARMAYQKQQNTMHDTEQSLMVQHSQLCYNLSTAFDTYNAQKQNLEVTQRVFDNISRRYEQGYSSAMDLTNTGTTLINAQSTYVQSIMEFLNARIALEKLLNK